MERKFSNAVELVEEFLLSAFVRHDFEAAEELVSDQFVLRSSGSRLITWDRLRSGIEDIIRCGENVALRSLDAFANEDGSRVVSHWRLDGMRSIMKCGASHREGFVFGGLLVWTVGKDGRLLQVWVERNTWDVLSAWIGRTRMGGAYIDGTGGQPKSAPSKLPL